MLPRPGEAGPHPTAEQAVAAAQVVVEEIQRSADREGVQPQGDLGQLDRHRIPVDAVDAPLERHPPDDAPVVQLRRIEGPAVFPDIGQQRLADAVDAPGQRGDVPLDSGSGLAHGGDHVVGELVDEVDEEVAGAHGGIADPEFQQPLGGIEPLEAPEPVWRSAGRWLGGGGDFGFEGVQALLRQRLEGFLDDDADQVVGRVVAAGALAGVQVGPEDELAVFADDLVFENALVDRAELLDAQVAVVDVAAAFGGAFEGKQVEDLGDDLVAEFNLAEQGRTLPVEEASVVGRDADRRVALVQGFGQIADRSPVAGLLG